ncbi:MAG TPA: hypothetical protein VF533_08255 [Solirubrobacteraceae bacterium]|jgi:hypothetical protein
MTIVRRVAGHARHNVVAYLALFVSLGGTGAYAANTIGSADIVDESIQSVDLKNGQVKRADVAADAIDASRVANGSLTPYDIQPESLSSGRITGLDGSDVDQNGLTGNDILESSLGEVPSAAKLAPPEPRHYIGDENEPAFQNGWRNYSAEAPSHNAADWQHAGYYKDNAGIVHLVGMMAAGTIGQPSFVLPPAYCPWFYHAFPVVSNNAMGKVTVGPVSGGCMVRVDAGSNEWVALDSMSWPEAALETAE